IDIANQTLFSPEARPAPLMVGTKGSHLIVDNADLRDALADHMIYYENEYGRICFLFPYLGKVLVGLAAHRFRIIDADIGGADE
ncbi:glycerol-3-phosphate dehydrogenase, partial [Rhizobium ruizarguesonis]